ncbi:MAG: 3',5'-cyclic-AMP phosphodiesterase [Gammaproteobacteria bacterium]|nr:3',5'-cyclic-AMP phosphodiesterase [Gammaproteobacteria bacterium]
MSTTPSRLRLLHITDPHLHADTEGRMHGVVTFDTFRAVIEQAMLDAQSPDVIIATGDLVHDETLAGYQLFQSLLAPLNTPVLCIPGNHDTPTIMSSVLNAAPFQVNGSFQAHGWLLIMLNSFIDGNVAGYLSSAELMRLSSTLHENPSMPTLVCLHHHPLPMGSRWLDGIALQNPQELFEIIDAAPQVRGILWGHVHQASDRQRNGIRLISTPSTCSQFRPDCDDFTIDNRPPGFRWLDLQADGTIHSEVIWLD